METIKVGQKIKTLAYDGTKVIYEVKRITKLMVFCKITTEKGKVREEESKIYKTHFNSWVESQNIFNW